MALSTQPYKGTRDFYPEDKRLQNYMFNTMREVVEQFGYEEYDAPILEPLDLYLAKTGEEIVNEQTYTFTDRGDRKVAIRPEMTPTVSRMVAARRQEFAYPERLFNIGGRWRYERPQRGRYREFFQLDVDIFGVPGPEAEHETILVADSVMQAFGANREMYSIKLNSRQLMNHIFDAYLQLNTTRAHDAAKLIDRMNKMEAGKFAQAMQEIIQDNAITDKLLGLLSAKTIEDLPTILQKHPSLTVLKKLQVMLETSGISNCAFDVTLMRGFDYYTDIVFEVFDNHPDNNRAMFGGGRYDGLVGLFGVEPVPTVGFAMGDATLQNFLETHKLLPADKHKSDVYVVLVGDVYTAAQPVLAQLRHDGLNVTVDTSGRKPDKQTRAADKKGLAKVLFIGEKELKDNSYTVKDLKTGLSKSYSLEELAKALKA